jgi:arabinofuranosyltransferase
MFESLESTGAEVTPVTTERGRFLLLYPLFSALAVFAATAYFALLATSQLSGERIGIDDANIYFRYARNIANGFGIVWNPGGEHVEGGTSFLWTLVCAGAWLVSKRPERLLLWLSVVTVALALAGFATCYSHALVGRRFGWKANVLAGLVIASVVVWAAAAPPYLAWTTATLLDTGLWGACLLAGCALTSAFIRRPSSTVRRIALAVALSLLALARPEGVVLSFALVGFAALPLWRDLRSVFSVGRTLRVPLSAAVGTNAALFLFRRVYFGFWLPNTYYAKIGGDTRYNLEQGFAYFKSYLSAYPLAAFATVLAVTIVVVWFFSALLGRRRSADEAVIDFAGLSAGLFAVGVFNGIYVGGDHFGSWRFFQPYWPFALVVLTVGPALVVSLTLPEAFTKARGMLALIAVALAWGSAGLSYAVAPAGWNDLAQKSLLKHEFGIAEQGRHVGEALNEILAEVRPRPRIGLVMSGGSGFAYDGFSYDLLGLNNVAMAHATRDRAGYKKNHAAFNKNVFFQQAPDILLVNQNLCDLNKPVIRLRDDWVGTALKRVDEDPEFQRLYVPVVFATPAMKEKGQAYCEWAKRTLVEYLANRVFFREVGSGS